MWKSKFLALILLSVLSMESRADEWERMEGAEELEAFVSGATAEITLTPGVVARGEHSDGTAKIEAWNEVFPRTWEVRGGDQVCYSSETETNCFSPARSRTVAARPGSGGRHGWSLRRAGRPGYAPVGRGRGRLLRYQHHGQSVLLHVQPE